MSCSASLTERLQLFMQGDSNVVDSLLSEVLPKLREIAFRELKRERYMAPLSKTELVHEVWISALSRGVWNIRDRGHFYALVSLAMRRILVDMARKRLAQRRGAGLSQTQVAARMGTSQSAVARLEAGEADVRASTLERYAAAIGSQISWRLEDTPPREQLPPGGPDRGPGPDPAPGRPSWPGHFGSPGLRPASAPLAPAAQLQPYGARQEDPHDRTRG